MKYDPERHRRRSIRLKGYDYSQAGAYFVTIVTRDRACLFGEVVDGEMCLNDPGRMVEKWWCELNHKFPITKTDEYIVMPNHFHGVIVIVGGRPACLPPIGRTRRCAPTANHSMVQNNDDQRIHPWG